MRGRTAFGVYLVADVLCVGAGMGVPIFCIALGFPTGWLIGRIVLRDTTCIREILARILRYSLATTAFTFLGMIAIWGPPFLMLFDPAAAHQVEHFGIPLILYEAKASFIGWLVLMVLISPFLQLLATVFSAYLTLWRWARRFDERMGPK